MPKTAATMTRADIPKGRQPEEFLNTRDLMLFYKREMEALAPDARDRAEVIDRYVRARRAYLSTLDEDIELP